MSTDIDTPESQPGKVVILDENKDTVLVGNVTRVEWDPVGFDATGEHDLVVMKDYAKIFGVVEYCYLKFAVDECSILGFKGELPKLTAQVSGSRLRATGRVSKLSVYNDLKEDSKTLSFCVTVRFAKVGGE